MPDPVQSSDAIPIDRDGTPPFVTQVPEMGRRTTTKNRDPEESDVLRKGYLIENLLWKERMTML